MDFQNEITSKYKDFKVTSGTKVCYEHLEEEDFKTFQKDEPGDFKRMAPVFHCFYGQQDVT